MIHLLLRLVVLLAAVALSSAAGLYALWVALGVGVAAGGIAAAGLFAAGTVYVLAAVVWHELGHLAFGLAVGLKYLSFKAGQFRHERHGVPRRRAAEMAGFVAFDIPPDLPRPLMRFAAMIAAGPAASLAAAVALGVLAQSVNPEPPADASPLFRTGWRTAAVIRPRDALTGHIALFAAVHLGTGLLTLLPSAGKNYHSDGLLLLAFAVGKVEIGDGVTATPEPRGAPA